ncbi:MAG TPA: hypothetical protein VGG33_27980, partial [Polyangia bacterium]
MPHVDATVSSDNGGQANGRRIALNRSERVYLALDGVAGSIAQTHVLRFSTVHSVEELRAAIRTLVRTTPRLRTRVARDWRGWCLRVRADDTAIDDAFANAF